MQKVDKCSLVAYIDSLGWIKYDYHGWLVFNGGLDHNGELLSIDLPKADSEIMAVYISIAVNLLAAYSGVTPEEMSQTIMGTKVLL